MIGVIDYGAGNIFSLKCTLQRLGISYELVNDPSRLLSYDRYIIPGVGHAGAAMNRLMQSGMAEVIPRLEKPVLGICVGMQLMTRYSEEGDSQLLGLIPLDTLRFEHKISGKVPHMGWNQVSQSKKSSLFEEVDKDAYFYFVHSFYVPFDKELTVGHTDYGLRFSASIERDNFYGVQFHPEKSGVAGEKVLANFANI